VVVAGCAIVRRTSSRSFEVAGGGGGGGGGGISSSTDRFLFEVGGDLTRSHSFCASISKRKLNTTHVFVEMKIINLY